MKNEADFQGACSFSRSNGRVLVPGLSPQISNLGRIINSNRIIVVMIVFWQIKDDHSSFDILPWRGGGPGSSRTRMLCYCFDAYSMVKGQRARSQAQPLRDSRFYFLSLGTLTLGTPSHTLESIYSAGETTWRGAGTQMSPAFP